LLLLGAFATTTLDPRLSLSEQPIVLRRFVRWSIAVLMVLVGCTYFAPQVLRELGAGAELASLGGTVFLCTSGFAFLSWLVGICYYLARLAMRIPDVRLAKRVRSRVVRFVVCGGTVVAFWLVHAQGGWAMSSSKAGMDLYWLKAVMGLVWTVAAILALAFVGYGVSLMNLMSAYRKAFRKCLLEARAHAATT